MATVEDAGGGDGVGCVDEVAVAADDEESTGVEAVEMGVRSRPENEVVAVTCQCSALIRLASTIARSTPNLDSVTDGR